MRRLTAFVRAVLVLASVSIVAPAALALASERRFGGRLPFHGVPAPSAWDVDRIERAMTSRLDEQTVVDVVIRLSLVVAWELSWYRYRVDLGDEGDPVMMLEKGDEIDQIDAGLRDWNATLDSSGRVLGGDQAVTDGGEA